jgi:pimeloyl-ACP methyl ester carboxylesterase
MKSPHAERLVADNGGEIVYHAFGTGRPVLFVCGLAGSWLAFRHQISHLSDRYRCLVWDYRGLFRGRDDPPEPPRSISDHARDALAILEHEGGERTSVLGWSLGVQVVLQLFSTAAERISSLVLVGGGARAPWGSSPEAGPIRRFYPTLIDVFERAPGLLSSLLRGSASSPETFAWARRIGLVGPEVDAELFAEVARSLARLDVETALRTMREMMQRDLSGVLPGIDIPTLVIGGDRDPFSSRASLERLVRGIGGAEYLLLPGASHYLLMDHAQHVNLRIDKFFAERGFTP